MFSLKSSLLFLGTAKLALGGVAGLRPQRRDVTPQLPYDEKTTSECTWWHDQTTDVACNTILGANAITIDQFRRWNPSIGPDCAGVTKGKSYCVEAAFEEVPTDTPTPSPTVPTSTPSASPTAPSNGKRPRDTPSKFFQFLVLTRAFPLGIESPLPVQPGMVGNCDAFYLVKEGDNCATIAAAHGITLAQFQTWNTKTGTNCAGLWLDAHACVSVIGHTPPTPSPTSPSNG